VILDDDIDRRLRLVCALLFAGRRRSLGRVLDWALSEWLAVYGPKLGIDSVPAPSELDVPAVALKPVVKPVSRVDSQRREETVRDALKRLGLSRPS
jgi:hypothetical protein